MGELNTNVYFAAQKVPGDIPRWRLWLMAARIPTLPAAVVPVVVGTAAAYGKGSMHIYAFIAAFVAAVLIQVGTNLANDYYDFQKGADTEERLGPTRVTQAGLIPPEEVARGMWVSFGIALLLTLYLIAVGGWPIFVIFVFSVAAGILYTGGPWPLGYNGLGDLFAFLFFGVIAVTGTYFLHTSVFDAFSFTVSLPIGFLVANILVVNNLRDIETDRKAGKRTLAVRLGAEATRLQYALLAAGAYLFPVILWGVGALSNMFWLPFLSLPLAIRLVRTLYSGTSGRALNPVLKQTGQLELLYGLLFSLALIF